MPQIYARIDEADYKQIQQKAAEFGINTSIYVRQVLKDSLRKTSRIEPAVDPLKAIRSLIPIMVEVLGRTQNVSQPTVDKMIEVLLKKYDQQVSACN